MQSLYMINNGTAEWLYPSLYARLGSPSYRYATNQCCSKNGVTVVNGCLVRVHSLSGPSMYEPMYARQCMHWHLELALIAIITHS